MSESNHDTTNELEWFEETEITSVEMQYQSGELDALFIEATYKKGDRPTDSALTGERIDDSVSVQTCYKVLGTKVVLEGFYPDTRRTGPDLWRETLKCLTALQATEQEVRDRVDDRLTIEPVARAIDKRVSNN